MKTTSKNGPPLPLEIFLMTSHHNSHTITDVKPEMISGVETGNGIQFNKYDICGIAQARTDRKDDIFI